MKTVFDSKIPPPPPRTYKSRLTPELRKMKPGMSVAVKEEVARSLAAWIRSHGGQPVTRDTGDGLKRVWWL